MATKEDWHEFVVGDVTTYPNHGAWIEVEYENGERAKASFSHATPGDQPHINLLSVSTEITGGTAAKRWRHLMRH